ncbi:xanthine dehydrogenase family protein subunit M [Cellulomonas sp. URHE0023]|uniref:FAD binding domain-containing protein n=1 Tax=Cellulomonas sp. URHE0023 TaxID=1380354 RepID=UPI0004822257|nr:FAD binding domain-containing protein [Cellulomonas sp. URHE0023]
MDLTSLDHIRTPRTRSDLVLGPRSAPLAGGTWLFSEAQPDLTELVDLTGLGWAPFEVGDGLTIGATCTLRQLADLPTAPGRRSQDLVLQCLRSLVMSEKIWDLATVGGNICLALPAGALITLAVALDATAVVWTPSGGSRELPVLDLVTGVRSTALAPGEVLRSIVVEPDVLASPAAFARVALTRHGRTGAIVVGRRAGDGLVATVTGGVPRPRRFAFSSYPSSGALAAAIDTVDDWYDDPHGAPDWRRAQTLRLAEQVRVELA